MYLMPPLRGSLWDLVKVLGLKNYNDGATKLRKNV